MAKANYREENGRYVCELVVSNQLGFHARPSALIAKMFLPYDVDVACTVRGNRVSAKSIMGLMTLEASLGDTVIFEVSGDRLKEEGPEALDKIADLFEKKFFEA